MKQKATPPTEASNRKHIGQTEKPSVDLSYSAGIDIEERISKRLRDKFDQEQSKLDTKVSFVERWLNSVSVVSTVLAIAIAVLSVFATFWGRDIIKSARKDMDETIETIKKLEKEAEKFRHEAETEVEKSRDLSNQVLLLRKDVQSEVGKVTYLSTQVDGLKQEANTEVQSMRLLTKSAYVAQTNLLTIKSSVVEIRDEATTKLNQIDEYVSTTKNKVDSLFAKQIKESATGFDEIISKEDVVVSLTSDEVDRLSSFLSSPYGSLGDKLRTAILINLHKKDFKPALQLSETLYNLEPHSIATCNVYLQLLNYCGKYAQTETVCQQIMQSPTFHSTFCSNNLVFVQNSLGISLLEQERYKEAESVFSNAIYLCESQLGLDNEITLKCRLNHFMSLSYQGEYIVAEELAKRTLAGFEKILGKNNATTLWCQFDLAIIMQEQHRTEEALAIMSNVEQRVVANFGERAPLSLRVKASKAFFLFASSPVQPSRLTEVTNILTAVSAQCKDVFGSDDRLTLYCRYVLRIAGCMSSGERTCISASTIEELQSIKAAFKRNYGESEPMYVKLVASLILVYREFKQYADAEDIARELLLIEERKYGIDDERTVRAMKDLASIIISASIKNQDISKYHDAEIMCRNVLARQKRLEGGRTGDQIESNFLIAQLLWCQKLYNDADSLFKSTIAEADQAKEASPTNALKIRVSYMERLASVNRFEDVVHIGEESLNRYSTVTNTDFNVITANHLIGTALLSQNKCYKADMFLRNAYNGHVGSKGMGSHEAFKSGNLLCFCLVIQNKRKDAQELMECLLKNCCPVLGAERREIIQGQCFLAFIYDVNGELNKAEALMRETVERSKRVFGADDIDTVECLYILSGILADNGKKREAKQFLAAIPKNAKRRTDGICVRYGFSFFGLSHLFLNNAELKFMP
jgi:tetratricopeptide (TPR) repeat protein